MSAAVKQFVGAIGLVRRSREDGRDEWLALWNAGRKCYTFVEAHKVEDESFRQSLLREIDWATGLRTGKDFLVSAAPRAHLQFAEADSCRADPTWFVVEFYLVELMGRRHRDILWNAAGSVWVTAEDVQAGAAGDGRPLCPRLLSLLRQADLMVPWQAE